MSEQNNTIENNNNGETRECGICYDQKRWSCDGGDFIEGANCSHRVCDDCSVRITRCPFCRQPWKEDEPAEPEREHTITEIFGEDSDDEEEEEEDAFTLDEFRASLNIPTVEEETLTVEELMQSINTLSNTYHELTARLQTETDMEQIEATNHTLISTLELLLGFHNRVERLTGFVAQPVEPTEDETDQPEREYLAQEAEQYAQEEHIGQYPDHHYCTECMCCIGCGCCECGDDPANYCPQCTYALGCCQCPEEEQNEL